MSPAKNPEQIRLALPKGRMAEGVFALLADAGVRVRLGAREYRPEISLPGFEVKILKPQAIVKMLEVGARDLGFTGADWVAEFDADLVELLDTGLDRVRLVAAAPPAIMDGGSLRNGPLVVTSEMENLTRRWIGHRGLDACFLRSFGATEVYPPEDADCIVDVVATGATLRSSGLQIVDELLTSTTRLYAHRALLEDGRRRARVDDFVVLLRSVLEARQRVLLEVNVGRERLETLVELLPCMRRPTIAALHGEHGYAVKVAVPRDQLHDLIPRIRAAGGTDIVVSEPSQIVA